MDPAQTEVPKNPEELVAPVLVGGFEKKLQASVAEQAGGYLGRPMVAGDVAPVTNQGLVNSRDVRGLNIAVVGSETFSAKEEAESVSRNAGYFMSLVKKKLIGGGAGLRTIPGRITAKLFRHRVKERGSVPSETSPSVEM